MLELGRPPLTLRRPGDLLLLACAPRRLGLQLRTQRLQLLRLLQQPRLARLRPLLRSRLVPSLFSLVPVLVWY